MNNVTDSKRIRPSHMTTMAPHLQKIAVSLLAIGLVGCTSITGDKVDYRGASEKNAGLEVPPDLTQLARDTRYQQQAASGSFSAATYGVASQKTQGTQAVVPSGESDLRIERVGSDRWLVTKMSPQQVWPVLEAFWPERGFKIAIDQPEVGVMETEWAENHSKMPQDFIRSTLGSLFDSVYDTGERDKFRTRVERTDAGSEIYITHRGMTEVATGTQSDSTFRIRGHGMPVLQSSSRGDILARVQVEVPTRLDAEQRKALEHFAQLCGEENTPIHKSFTERLKDLFS
jgi:outer membrane protein assembly factor BamC